jgi:hypothetical protein
MKKLSILFIPLAFLLASCAGDESEAQLSSESLNESVVAYISNNYPDATVDNLSVSTSGATAVLNTGEEISFDTTGSVIYYSNASSYGLSVDSLKTTHDSIFGGKHHGKSGKTGHKGNPKGKHHKNDLSVDSLSTTINDYIASNYAGYVVTHASTDTLCSGAVISVMVCDSLKEPVKLVFGTDGTFLMSGVRIKSDTLPEAITTAITGSFADYTLTTRSSLYTLANGSKEYKVYLKLDKKIVWVFFSADGVVLCQKK